MAISFCGLRWCFAIGFNFPSRTRVSGHAHYARSFMVSAWRQSLLQPCVQSGVLMSNGHPLAPTGATPASTGRRRYYCTQYLGNNLLGVLYSLGLDGHGFG